MVITVHDICTFLQIGDRDIFGSGTNFVSRHNTIVIENPIGVWGDMTGMSLETVINTLDDVGFHRF